MNRYTKYRVNYRVITDTALCGLMLIVLTGCGSSTLRPENSGLRASEPISLSYEVQKGDSLALISKRLTGTEAHWSEIASVNGIDNPRALHVGMVLLVPEYLIPEFGETIPVEPLLPPQSGDNVETNPNSPAETTATESTPSISQREDSTNLQSATDNTDWIFQASSLPGVLEAQVVIHQANANRKFDVERVSIADADPTTITVQANPTTESIRVVGSYFPKGVYTQPSYTSDLLMRVSPGTLFELERSVGEWLQIRTEKGSGYIRATDAEILSAVDKDDLVLSDNE